jgi:hypothetical protein
MQLRRPSFFSCDKHLSLLEWQAKSFSHWISSNLERMRLCVEHPFIHHAGPAVLHVPASVCVLESVSLCTYDHVPSVPTSTLINHMYLSSSAKTKLSCLSSF